MNLENAFKEIQKTDFTGDEIIYGPELVSKITSDINTQLNQYIERDQQGDIVSLRNLYFNESKDDITMNNKQLDYYTIMNIMYKSMVYYIIKLISFILRLGVITKYNGIIAPRSNIGQTEGLELNFQMRTFFRNQFSKFFKKIKECFYLPTNQTFRKLNNKQKKLILIIAKIASSNLDKFMTVSVYHYPHDYSPSQNRSMLQSRVSYGYMKGKAIKLDKVLDIPNIPEEIDEHYFYSRMKHYFPKLEKPKVIIRTPMNSPPTSYANTVMNMTIPIPSYENAVRPPPSYTEREERTYTYPTTMSNSTYNTEEDDTGEEQNSMAGGFIFKVRNKKRTITKKRKTLSKKKNNKIKSSITKK